MALSPELEDSLILGDENPAPVFGHVPLLWVLAPLVVVLSGCFAWDWHWPGAGAGLCGVGGLSAALLAWLRPLWQWRWRCACLLGMAGAALVIFDARVPPLPDYAGLPPREANLVLRWEQVFSKGGEARSLTGVARVVDAPAHLRELLGTDVYCQVRRPVPELLAGRGAVFRATGVLDTAARQFSDMSSDGFVKYLAYRRAPLALTRCRLEELVREPGWLQQWSDRQGIRMEAVLRRGLAGNPEAADLLVAMMLGRVSALSEGHRDAFARTGTMHLFAISGLHVGVIATALFWAGRRIRLPDTSWRLVVIGIMLAFVLATGAAPSALRAWLMIACMLLARVFRKKSTPLAGLVLAATAVLLWEPRTLLNIGFQLSYCVVAVLLLYGLPLAAWLNARWQPWRDLPEASLTGWQRVALSGKRRVVDGLGIGAASTLASAPLIVDHFNLFSTGAVLVNLVAVPLSMPVMLLGFAGLTAGVVGPEWVAVPFNWFAGQILTLLKGFVQVASGLPGMAWYMEFRADWVGTLMIFCSLSWLFMQGSLRRVSGRVFLILPISVLVLFLLCGRPA